MNDKFTIAVLLYGDYPELAQRCLSSITSTIKISDLNLRVGLNEVAPHIVSWVKSFVPEENIWEYDKNINKYPLMRQMIHGMTPVETEYFMWFDDDSYLEGYEVPKEPYWLSLVDEKMQSSDLIGGVYTRHFQGKQREWIKDQPWFNKNNTDLDNRKSMRFATGGWWTIRSSLLYEYNYPWPELDHNGGDALLGELCRQQGLRLNTFRTGVKINADEHGKESEAKRRGTSQKMLGVDYNKGPAVALHRATSNPPTR